MESLPKNSWEFKSQALFEFPHAAIAQISPSFCLHIIKEFRSDGKYRDTFSPYCFLIWQSNTAISPQTTKPFMVLLMWLVLKKTGAALWLSRSGYLCPLFTMMARLDSCKTVKQLNVDTLLKESSEYHKNHSLTLKGVGNGTNQLLQQLDISLLQVQFSVTVSMVLVIFNILIYFLRGLSLTVQEIGQCL